MTRSNEWTSRARETVLEPGAIAAELGNGDPNGRRCGEVRRGAPGCAGEDAASNGALSTEH